MIGTTISHYRIISKLGQGGMGEVFLAEDSNLNRKVAVKVLSDPFIKDPVRLARFDREAKLLASLNHPNIASIYGLERTGPSPLLIMELIDGDTLADRIATDPLTLVEALEVCSQIAEGLEAAHEKGIIHRDLKPANVKVTPDGKVKILDFGLAKAFQEDPSDIDPSKSPTLASQMTGTGMVVGTAAYMSPEQARCKPVDKRTDIWAFGCILFECLTGKKAFGGDAAVDSMASILKGEPDWDLLPPATPWKIKDLLHRCLRKELRDRLHDIGDARLEIVESLRLPTAVPKETQAASLVRHWRPAFVLSTLVLVGAAASIVTWRLRPPRPLPVLRSLLRIEAGQWLEGRRLASECPTRTAISIAHDGSFVVYCAIAQNPGPQAKPQIYLRRMDQLDATPIPGTEGGINPFLSPDNRWLGFWEGGKLKKLPIGGGVPSTLCDAASLFGVEWNSGNEIVFSPREGLGLFKVSGDGGKPKVFTVPDKTREEASHRLPHYLPDGKGMLFTVMAHIHDLQPRLALLDLETGKWRVVMEDAADGRYLRSGHLIFLRQGTLMAAAFDLDSLEVKSQPVPAVANVMQALNITDSRLNTAAGQYNVSDAGSLVYVPGGIPPDRANSMVRVDRKGAITPVANFKSPFFAPRFSPDGQRIAYQTLGKQRQVWVYDSNRSMASRLTGDGRAIFQVWMPDAKRLVFGWYQSGQSNLYWQPADGSAPMERLTVSDNGQFPGSFSPDGATLAFCESHPETNNDILLLDMKSRKVVPFLNSKADEGWPEISPCGRWIAYVSDESGQREVWIRSFPGQGNRLQISHEGGSEPAWAKDGRQLYYRQGAQVWAADIRTEGEVASGKPSLVFEQRGFASGNPIRGWDVYPDGQGFLMVKLDEGKQQPVTEIILVQNWFEELERLCPTGKR